MPCLIAKALILYEKSGPKHKPYPGADADDDAQVMTIIHFVFQKIDELIIAYKFNIVFSIIQNINAFLVLSQLIVLTVVDLFRFYFTVFINKTSYLMLYTVSLCFL